MSNDIFLREYRAEDLESMFRLDEACFASEFRFDREAMQEFASEGGAVVCIAEKEGELVGFVIVHLQRAAAGLQGYVVTLDVAPEFRQQGVAQRLVSKAEDSATAKRARWIELHVYVGNSDAIRFYERAGYTQVALRRRFYGKTGLDAFVYRKALFNL